MVQSLARSSPPRNTCTHPPTNRPTNQPTNRPPKLYFEARASSGYPPGPEFSILLTEEILQVKSAREWMLGVTLGGIRSPPRPPKFQCCASPGASPNGGNVRKLKRAPHTFPNIEILGAGGAVHALSHGRCVATVICNGGITCRISSVNRLSSLVSQ